MTVALIGYSRWCVAHGWVASLGEVTLELRLKTGMGVRQVERVREGCFRKKGQHMQRMEGS